MQVNTKTILALIGMALLPIIAISAYVYLVVFNPNPSEEVQLGVIATQFQQYKATAERYRSRLLDYAGMCDDIGLPDRTVCQATDTDYRISQLLTDGTYYCMDTAGFKGVTPTPPQGITCPKTD